MSSIAIRDITKAMIARILSIWFFCLFALINAMIARIKPTGKKSRLKTRARIARVDAPCFCGA